MPSERKRVWSLGRQIPGNLIPVLLSFPLLGLSVQEIVRFGVTPKGILLGLAFFVVGWMGVNFLGLFGNRGLRHAIEMRFKDEYEYDKSERFFAGFSRPGKYGLLDPHEDLGFLVFRDEELEFFGEVHHVSLPYSAIKGVGKRANIHSLLGLGGWVAVDAEVGGKLVRLQVEPRVKATHWGNSRLRKEWISKIAEKIVR
ncbi:hypothetical protein CCB80_12210 [Armatimonadetes bacterium Uphvl-Ar1]|nr:hypothetical protein CCB80_12210 [Armatimonadetes bacterium Uphvl-Ar1]